jgi:hypothetical protein
MNYLKCVLTLMLLVTGCGMHAVKCPMAGDWYSTIEGIEVLLELTCVDGTATGGLKLLEDPGSELPAGAVLPIIEGTCSNETVRFYLDADQNGTKSDGDVYIELHLEEKVLTGFGHELDDPDDKRDLTFKRSRK